MRLEIISRYPKTGTSPVPLLFVHGSFGCAEVWDEFFLPYFAQRGYAAHALSLRGHGGSDGRAKLPWWGLADYVGDLVRTVRDLDRPPVLIGHSMGGMVVQKYLETHPASGAVLMASVPPQGLLSSLWGMAVDQPLLLCQMGLLQSCGPAFAWPSLIRQALFSEDLPEHQARRYFRLLQGESQRVSLDMLGLNPLRRNGKSASVPMLVMGAGRDALISTHLVNDTARYYQAEVILFPDLAHVMMLEVGWMEVADYLLHWLKKRYLAPV